MPLILVVEDMEEDMEAAEVTVCLLIFIILKGEDIIL
jgi:hypothetical protein